MAPYILMEFLEGVSLRGTPGRPRPSRFAAGMETRAPGGSALAAAHAAGIVHRDLKPENLFLIPDACAPNGERVEGSGFCIAKVRRRQWHGWNPAHATGVIMGSPAYMSPEQCKDSADVDSASDIYSFATIIYEALAGRTRTWRHRGPRC